MLAQRRHDNRMDLLTRQMLDAPRGVHMRGRPQRRHQRVLALPARRRRRKNPGVFTDSTATSSYCPLYGRQSPDTGHVIAICT
mgnify:CR=1 FL=1